MAVAKASDSSFEADVLKSAEPVLVDFWAEWCGPCRVISPIVDEVAAELQGKLKVVKVNVDENPAIATKYQIMSIPTLMIFKNGAMAARQIGALPKAKIVQWIHGAI
jgi:thioredoxin 1